MFRRIEEYSWSYLKKTDYIVKIRISHCRMIGNTGSNVQELRSTSSHDPVLGRVDVQGCWIDSPGN